MVSIIIHDRHGRSRVIDAGAQGSQGTVGTAYGGTPRHAPRVQKAPGVKAGGFTVDQPPVPRLPGAMAGSTHQAAAQQHDALAAHHQGLNYGAQNPVSRAHAEAAKAHKAAHSLLGKPGYNQAANWANSATEHAGRLSKPQDAAPPPPKPPQARMGPQQTGPDIKAGSNRPMPNPRPAPQPYRGYDAAASPRAAGTPQPPKPPTPPKPPSPKPPPAAAAPKPPPPPAPKAPPAAPAPKTAGHGANPVQTALHGVAGALHGVRSATETGNWLLSLQQGRVGDQGTSIGGRRGQQRRRHLKAEDEAKTWRNWLDAWFPRRTRVTDTRTIDEWFHDFDESKVKRDHGRFAEQSGASETAEGGGAKRRATNIQVKPGTRPPGRGAQQPPAGGGEKPASGQAEGKKEEEQQPKKKVTKKESPALSLHQNDAEITDTEFYDPAKGHMSEEEAEAIAGIRAELKAIEDEQGNSKQRNMKDGVYTEEAKALHKKALREAVFQNAATAKPAPGEKPQFIMLGGRGGSGKSMFTEGERNPDGTRQKPMFDTSKFVVIDSDKIKYALGSKGWDVALYHEEASDLVDDALAIAKQEGYNVILDATMKTRKTAQANLEAFKGLGYTTGGHFMQTPPAVAARNAIDRFKTKNGDFTGRFVPPEIILANKDNEQNFDTMRDQFDDWSVYNNPTGKNPAFYASKSKPD